MYSLAARWVTALAKRLNERAVRLVEVREAMRPELQT